MIAKKTWADGPWKLIPVPETDPTSHPGHELTHLMVGLHNAFLRGINSAYLQAPYVRLPADLRDLATYISLWMHVLHKHHHAEETVGFPAMMRASGGELGKETERNVEQHEMLDGKLDELEVWLKEDVEKEGWVGELRRRIEQAMEVIHVHLVDEIPTIQALAKYEAKGVRKAINLVEKEVQAKTEFYKDMPFLFGTHDATFSTSKATFPAIPSFLRYVDYYIWERGNRGVWRFNPCDPWSQPRDLCFLP